jgi:ribonuclease-3 family protein
MTESKARLTNPVVLAFLGDAVYSLWVREQLVRSGEGKAAEFQRAAANLESARGQSAYLERILPLFTQTEEEIYRRARNAKKATKSKTADAGDYTRSTGFEAVLGYLHLIGDTARIEELLSYTDKELLKGQAAFTPFKP